MRLDTGAKWLLAAIVVYGIWFVVDSVSRFGDLFASMVVLSAAMWQRDAIVKEFGALSFAVR